MTEDPIDIRVATFNASLNRNSEGQLISDLSTPDNAQAKAVAEIIQRTDADVILINEFDYDNQGPGGSSLAVQEFLQNYLNVSQNGADPIDYPYVYIAPSNTGAASGFDLNNNGVAVTVPGAAGYGDDALGFGNFEGQYGMLLLSKYPIDMEGVRTFQNFLWKDMSGALLPDNLATPEAGDWYSPEELDVLPLSSKSHWDIPIIVDGQVVHILAAHPTPPTFDGIEDRNGLRNHDEIRFWSDYIDPSKSSYVYDDAGSHGGLAEGSRFIILGDYNADPNDGDSYDSAIHQLLDNSRIDDSVKPHSLGGPQQALLQGGANNTHVSNPLFDTADFADGAPGNLRTDYVLGSHIGLTPVDGSVFWPLNSDPLFSLVGTFPFPSSDHRLVEMDFQINQLPEDSGRAKVAGVEFLGQATFSPDTTFNGTQVGGLSGITYDAATNTYYSISDDRSQINPARFYTLNIDLSDGSLDNGDVTFTSVTTLLQPNGSPFATFSLDPEGITITGDGTVYVSSEGDTSRLINPFINEFSLTTGQQVAALPIDAKYLPTATGTSGIRNNLAFESLTITPDGRYLYSATENALFQDGDVATLDDGTSSRIFKYDLQTGQVVAEYIYQTEPVAEAPNPAGGFVTNGLVELLAIDNNGTLLAMERSFSTGGTGGDGTGDVIKIYEILTQGATDVSGFDAVNGYDIDAIVEKRLLIELDDLNMPIDNIEGMTLGPVLGDGRQSLILVSDDNFSSTQFTQFLAFALDIDTLPSAAPVLETPAVTRYDVSNPDAPARDLDDPAIYLNANDATKSFVITSEKLGGFSTYRLDGSLIEHVSPDGVRYNNVDLIYNFQLGDEKVDLAVFSDRLNDTLAIYKIDPDTQSLINVTAADLSNPAFSIFGIDNGKTTAYGLATYTSIKDGEAYAYTTEAGGAEVAQLKLIDHGDGTVSAEVVRMIDFPVPAGEDPDDYQSEGIVVDQETGLLYVSPEDKIGIMRYSAEADGGQDFTVVQSIDQSFFTPDIEGLSIYYGENGQGYLVVSSQGDNTFSIFERGGDNAYLGTFIIGTNGNVDGVQETDGIDIFSGALPGFPGGLMVVQDGSNEPQNVFVVPGDDEIQNYSTSFKFVPWENVTGANGLPSLVSNYDPRAPHAQANVIVGSEVSEALTGTKADDLMLGLADDDSIVGNAGDDIIEGGSGADTLRGGSGNDVIDGGAGNDRLESGAGSDWMTGGEGADHFIFRGEQTTDGVVTLDVITDYSLADGDKIELKPGVAVIHDDIVDGNLILTLTGGDDVKLIGVSSLADVLFA